MVLAEIGTAGVISAYFFRHMTSGYSLNVSDPIKGQPVQLSDYLFVFGCGLVFWLLVMLRAKLHDSGGRQSDIRKVAKLAKLIAPITTLNLCGCLLVPFMKLPLLVRFLVLFQVSSNLALLLIWSFLSLKECMILLYAHAKLIWAFLSLKECMILLHMYTHAQESQAVQQQKSSPESQAVQQQKPSPKTALSVAEGEEVWLRVREEEEEEVWLRVREEEEDEVRLPRLSPVDIIQPSHYKAAEKKRSVPRYKATGEAVPKIVFVGCNVDVAGGSGSGHGSGASGREENRGRYGGNDGGGGAGGGGDRGASGSGYGSGASGSGGGNEGGDRGRDGGGDRGASGSGHGSGASGSGGGSEGGDRGRDGGGGDPESGGRETNTEQASKSFKITEMSLMLTAQTTATLMGFHATPTPSSSSKTLLVVALMDQLVAYLCCLTSILLSSNKPGDSKAAKIFADIGFVCTALGFILMVAMFVPWYLVLIAVLLFGVIWLIFFQDGLKTRATEVWNYLKNARNL